MNARPDRLFALASSLIGVGGSTSDQLPDVDMGAALLDEDEGGLKT